MIAFVLTIMLLDYGNYVSCRSSAPSQVSVQSRVGGTEAGEDLQLEDAPKCPPSSESAVGPSTSPWPETLPLSPTSSTPGPVRTRSQNTMVRSKTSTPKANAKLASSPSGSPCSASNQACSTCQGRIDHPPSVPQDPPRLGRLATARLQAQGRPPLGCRASL